MAAKTQPKITACKAGENWTCVTFKPDLLKFGMRELEDESITLMRKRVYDLAGIFGKTVKVGQFHKQTQEPGSLSLEYAALKRAGRDEAWNIIALLG